MPNAADPVIAPLLLWLLPVLAAGLLLWLWPGRRVACPPSCRRCGYDVSARPAGSGRCSECGADLAARRAVVTARRVRGRATTVALAALLVASGAWFAHLALPFEWARWYWASAPDGWVAAHAEGRPGPSADRALAAWLGRYAGGRLDAAGESRLHDHLLARQADLARPWDPAHGDLLHAALEAGKLSPAQAERFVRGTFPGIAFSARPAVRAGDPVAFSFASAGFRGGGRQSVWSAAHGATASFAGPPKVPERGTWGWGWGGWDGGRWTQVAYPKEAGTPGLTAGVRRLDVVVAVALTAGRSGDEPLTPAVEYRGAVDVEVLPAGAPVGAPVFDAASGDAVARAMRVGVFHWGDGRIFARVALEPAPVDRAFEIFVDYAGKRHRVGQRYAPAGSPSLFQGDVDHVPVKDEPGVGPMTLVLVGSGEPLAESVGQQKYWAGTITFPGLPLRPRDEAYGGGPDPLPPYRLAADRGPATGPSSRPATRPGLSG